MNRPSVLELLEASIAKSQNRIAVEWNATQLSYSELDAKANQIAARLRSGKRGKGALVLVMLDNSFHVIPALIGILRAGCVFVPLDLNNPEKRLQAMLSLLEPDWAILEPKYAELLERLLPSGSQAVEQLHLVDGEVTHGEHATADRPVAENDPDDLSYICFTSGSTGNPKAIAGRYKSIAQFIEWEIDTFEIDETCRLGQFTHYAFDAFLRDVFVPLCAGGTIVVPDSREILFDTNNLVSWMDQRRITLIHCVPSVFRMILSQDLKADNFADLKYIMMAGEKVFPADVKNWFEIFGERVQLVNFYGPTETTMIKFFYPITRADATRRSIPIGKPISGTRAIVVGEDGKICPPGSVGEIYIRTPYRSLGYYNAPDLTGEVFIQNPFNDDPSDIVYTTGDLGRVQTDGNFEFLGRRDHQVKIRGVRVELGEIESVLRDYEGIREAVVIEITSAGTEPYLCAYLGASQEFDTESLRENLFKSLPQNMVPAAFVVMESLPLTLNGKVDRRALPAPEKKRSSRPFVAPRSAIEEKLVAVWSELLAVEPVGVKDDFFELGGHSLLATRLMSRLRTEFQTELPLAVLFENSTVEKLAIQIAQASLANADEEELAKLLDEIEQFSDDSAKAALAQASQSN